MLAQKAQKVAGEDTVDILRTVAAAGERLRQRGHIGDAVEVHGSLLGPVTPIEISADADVPGVPGNLANVVNVLADLLYLQVEILGLGTMMSPSVNHHDGIEGHADYCTSLDQCAD